MDMITRLLTTVSILDEDNLFYSVITAILSHVEQVPNLTITELADLCAVSPATISRFVKYLRLGSFSHLKVEIARALPEQRPARQKAPEPVDLAPYRQELEAAFDSIRMQLTPAFIQSCAEALCKAKRVAFLFNTLQLVRELERELCLHGTLPVLVSGARSSLLSQMEPGDVLVCRVYDEWELDGKIESLRIAREKGVHVLLLSAVPVPETLADQIFSLGSELFAVSVMQEQVFFDELLRAYRYQSSSGSAARVE